MKIVGGKWSNWSGGVRCQPRKVVAPKDEVELAAAIRQAEGPVRAPGTGHSFTPVHASDGVLLDLTAFDGLKRADAAALTATLAAATPLWRVGRVGARRTAQGPAQKKRGHTAPQPPAGVVNPGPPGTGPTLKNFSAEV